MMGRPCSCQLRVSEDRVIGASHKLIETLGCTQTSWASADDKDVDFAADCQYMDS